MSVDSILPGQSEFLLEPGIVAILRTDRSDHLLQASKALVEGGITAIELTMTTPGALDILLELSSSQGARISAGMGTVLEVETARKAIESGARFLVTPVVCPAVIGVCREAKVPVACGAYSPTEAWTAHTLGADYVKIFPADGLGPSYIKNLLAPLPFLKIIPTGGVDMETCGAFIKAGAVAVAAGSSLVSPDLLLRQDWFQLTNRARQFVEAIRTARQQVLDGKNQRAVF